MSDNNEKLMSKNFFIPDVEDKENYTDYKIKIFRAVPENAVVVKYTSFTKKELKVVNKSGLLFFFPWEKSKLVSKAAKNIDYPPATYRTSDGIMVTIDFALTIKIVNAKKFEQENLNPLQELGVVTRSIINEFVKGLTETELMQKKQYDLKDIDKFNLFDEFAKNYGIMVTNIYFKSIELPKSLIDDYEKGVMQEKENKRRIAEAEANKKVASLEAESIQITSSAKANARAQLQNVPLEQLLALLQNSGMTQEQINSFINGYLFANSPNGKVVNIVGNTSGSSIPNTVASMEAIQYQNDRKENQANEDDKEQSNNFVGRRPKR